MSNETFLISIRQNNDLSDVAVNQLRMDLADHPLNQRQYITFADLKGNSRQYGVNQIQFCPGKLTGKKVLFLGSSVTFGYGALAESFVDYLWKKCGVVAIKDAENGTTLADHDVYRPGDSYYHRLLEELTETEYIDAFVLQLSTNDAFKSSKLGTIAHDKEISTKTVTGAIEAILTQVKSCWHCPIIIYSNPYFANEMYAQMVKQVQLLKSKYDFTFLDFYHDQAFQVNQELYMADEIHPTRAGYQEIWLPRFESTLNNLLD